ncbi:MAG: murein biosynthesis integral membrane protein MurJ [Bacteroidetes bacterium]|nr:murein biosynthesis integral membrane protein MurJ [Bacteroidota bacterium]
MKVISFGGAFRQISVLTGLSRILGFLRDVVFAGILGAGPAADAFLVALKLPNMFRRLTAEGALANAFVPTFADIRKADGAGPAMTLAAEVQTSLVAALICLVIIAEIFMPSIIMVLAPGFVATPDRLDAAIMLARVTFPYLPMISLVAFWAAIANAHDRFWIPAAMPLIFNACLISGALIIPVATGFLALERAMPLAVSLLVAGFLQLCLMFFVLRRARVLPHWRWPRITNAARLMWKRFLTASGGAIAMQINLIVDLVLASLLPVGAISWLYYADRIVQLPLGVIGSALGTALLPRLSAQFREKDIAPVKATLLQAISFAAFFTIPATAAMIAIGPQIITGLFQYGAFTADDARSSGFALAAYAVGLSGHLLVKILQAAFYAAHRAGFMLLVSTGAVACNIALSLVMMPVFGHIGLALATSISGLLAAFVLMIAVVKADYFDGASLILIGNLIARIAVATSVMVLCLTMLAPLVAGLAGALQLVILVVAGGSGYLVIAKILQAIPQQLIRG